MSSYAFQNGSTQATAFGVRVADALVRVKQELGVDELLLAIQDASSIASRKVADYLKKYQEAVVKILDESDGIADAQIADLTGGDTVRSARNIEKLIALSWKNNYELKMVDLNSQMPLAQQIVSKYMANFSVKPSMK
jgi:hypothetical protein